MLMSLQVYSIHMAVYIPSRRPCDGKTQNIGGEEINFSPVSDTNVSGLDMVMYLPFQKTDLSNCVLLLSFFESVRRVFPGLWRFFSDILFLIDPMHQVAMLEAGHNKFKLNEQKLLVLTWLNDLPLVNNYEPNLILSNGSFNNQ